MTCPDCDRAAKFHSYQTRRLLTAHGAVRVSRAYYYCGRCHQGFIPYDEVLGVRDEISPGILYEQGGEVLLTHLQGVELPAGTSGDVQEELRKLIGYFENNRHRTDYPAYRAKGWDIGSGSTEAGCKIIGERLKGSGMRWVYDGAATVGAMRALYVSGSKVWDGFWSQPHQRAA